ncbi:unnamed protein product [Oncorhynchus mykiss]|uniref:Uncharacterized protein n=1 Tax=Oncorhynchus mykiss TaxID=8022 RepID=A0A060Z362_ONCMY|nr:unnamed protein product [Oncorhynchus mykiss]
MASRRMETKPVITCLKTLLVVYSFVFWVSRHDKAIVYCRPKCHM